MQINHKQFGDLAEACAASFLRRRGYEIVARNWRVKQGELDIVARTGYVLCFVEVKALRANSADYYPEDHIDHKKTRQLVRLVEIFMARHARSLTDFARLDYQIDVIAVRLNTATRRASVRHYKNAIWA